MRCLCLVVLSLTFPVFAGEFWEAAFGAGIDRSISSIVVKGSDLYVGGSFNKAGLISTTGVAKWNGSEWTALGSGVGNGVNALVFVGNDLYAIGHFVKAGGTTVNGVTKWDGTNWSALGTGLELLANINIPHGFSAATDGTNLFVGGSFNSVGGVPAKGVAMWNGTTWSALGSGINDSVYALAYVNGSLYAGAHAVYRWDGTTWLIVGANPQFDGAGSVVTGAITSLAASGSTLYAAGAFTRIAGAEARGVARFDGVSWSGFSGGPDTPANGSFPGIFTVFANNEKVYVGGTFQTINGGTPGQFFAFHDGNVWASPDGGLSGITDAAVKAFALRNGQIVVGGEFSKAGKVTASSIVQLSRATVAPQITVAPNPALLADVLTFSTTVPSGATATWDFGDGTTATGALVTKSFSAAGVYTVTVSVNDQGITVVGATTVLVNAAAPSSGTENTFSVDKAQVSLNFQKSGSDSVKLAGLVPVEIGSAAQDTAVTLRVGQLTQSFTLTSKASAGDSSASFKLSGKLSDGAFTATPAKFSLSLKKALVSALQPLGFDNENVSNKVIELPVVLTIGQTSHLDLVSLTYNAKARKNGKAK